MIIWLVFGFLTIMLLGLTTQITLINNPRYLMAFGTPYYEMHDTAHIYFGDHDQIADTVFDVIGLHSKMLNQYYDQQQHQHYDGIIVAKIKGEEAKNILIELENGAGIYFQVTMDEDNNPVVELYKEKSFDAEKV